MGMTPGDGEGKAGPGLSLSEEVSADIARRTPGGPLRARCGNRWLEDPAGSEEISGNDEEPACARPNFLRQFPPSFDGAKSLPKRGGAVLNGACGSPKLQASFLSGSVRVKARHGRSSTCGGQRTRLTRPQGSTMHSELMLRAWLDSGRASRTVILWGTSSCGPAAGPPCPSLATPQLGPLGPGGIESGRAHRSAGLPGLRARERATERGGHRIGARNATPSSPISESKTKYFSRPDPTSLSSLNEYHALKILKR